MAGFTNPVMNGDYPDPAVCRVGEDYYLTGSTGHMYPGLTIYHSKNLVDWEFVCNPLRGFNGDVWAPDIVYYKGEFYIYFCASGSNWVIHSERIDSGWSEAVDLKIGHIDPGHCVDDEGNRCLFLSGIYMVRLAPDGLSVIGKPEKVLEPMAIPDEWDVEGFYPESPKITRHGGWYYLTYANGGTAGPATAHMVVSARAKRPEGPWEHSPYYPVLRTQSREEHWHCKGHGHIVDDIDGNWWIIYHAYEKGYYCHGRKLLLERIIWTDDGWFRTDQDGNAEGSTFIPAGEKINGTLNLSNDFSSSENGLLKGYGDSACTRYCTEKNRLVLNGIGEHPGVSIPLTETCGYHSYTAETAVKPEDGAEGGIILFYDSRRYNGVGFDGKQIRVYRLGGCLNEIEIECEKLYLRMVNKQNYVSFWYSKNGRDYKKIDNVIDTEPQNNNAYGGFRALRPGLYACGSGRAYFEKFEINEN